MVLHAYIYLINKSVKAYNKTDKEMSNNSRTLKEFCFLNTTNFVHCEGESFFFEEYRTTLMDGLNI